MPSHQVLLSTTVQLTPPYKRRRKRNNHHHQQGSNMSFSRLDMFSSSHNSIHSNNDVIGRNLNQISKEEFVIQENDSLAGQSARKRSSIHENDSMMANMISESKTRVRSISNPLPKVSQKARDSFSHSDTIVASSASTKNLSINKASPPSVLAAIPNISITTTTSNAIQQNSNLTIKGNNILTRLLRKSKESKMTKKHYHPPPLTRNPSNNQYLTVDGSLVTPNKKKHSNTTLSSFKSCSSSVSGTNNTNQSLSNISCCSTDSNVVPFIESPNNSHSRGEMNFTNPEGNNTENCLISDKVDLGKRCSIIDQEGDKNNYRTFESNGEKMTANATCLIDPTTILCLAEQEEAASSPIGVTNNPSSKFIRRLSSTLSQLSSQKPKRQKIRNCSNLSDCPQEIILHIASFILCTTTHTASLFAEFSISPTGANIIGSFSPSSITPIDSSTSTISRRNSSSTMRRIGHYPKYTPFPAELTRDYFNLMLTSKSFYSALEFDPENEDQFKNSIVEGFWKYMILWQYVYPNFPTIDKLEDYMRDLECKKALNISYKRLYSYVNTQSLQQKVVIPKKKNVVYDPSNYFYLLVAGVNFLVVQTIRALFFESKNDFECKSIKFNKEEFKVKVESCSFMDYSLAPNSAEYKFRGTDGVIFVAYMSSRSSLDAMIKYIEKCIEFRKKDEQRTTMDPPSAIILGTITKNTTLHEISLNDLWEVQKTYSFFIKDVVIVNTDTMENIQSSFEKISAMMYRARVKTYVKTLPIIDQALAKDDIALSQELKKRKSKLQIPSRNRKCTIM